MDTTQMSEEINNQRRRFFGTAAMTVAAVQLGMMGLGGCTIRQDKAGTCARDQAGDEHLVRPLKQIDAGVLNVGYAEAGPADGPAGHSSAWLAL